MEKTVDALQVLLVADEGKVKKKKEGGDQDGADRNSGWDTERTSRARRRK